MPESELINIYPKNFENKDVISAEIENYNSSDVRLAIGRVLVKLTTPENRN